MFCQKRAKYLALWCLFALFVFLFLFIWIADAIGLLKNAKQNFDAWFFVYLFLKWLQRNVLVQKIELNFHPKLNLKKSLALFIWKDRKISLEKKNQF